MARALYVVADSGLEVLSLSTDPSPDFRPALDTAADIDPRSLWSVVPTDLHDLPVRDRELVQSAWAGLIQYAAGLLAETAHCDQLGTLHDFPIRRPRKWIDLAYYRQDEVANGGITVRSKAHAPGLGLREQAGFQYGDPVTAALLTVQSGAQVCAYQPLAAGDVGLDTALRTQVSFRLSAGTAAGLSRPWASGDGEAWVMLGFGDPTADVQGPGPSVAVSTLGRVAAVFIHDDRTADWSLASGTVPVTAATLTLRVSWTPPDPEGGHPGRVDALVTSSVEGTAPVSVSPALAVPVLPTPAPSVTAALVTGADTRVRVRSPREGFLLAAYTGTRARIRAEFASTWYWTDPSLPPRTSAVPSLSQGTVSGRAWYQGRDYEIAESGTATPYLQTATPDILVPYADGRLWAEYVAADDRLLSAVYGVFVGTEHAAGLTDTVENRNLVAALLRGLVEGPNLVALSAALSALTGTPVAVEDGDVISVDTDDVEPVIVVRGFDVDRRYPYPRDYTPAVVVGQRVRAGDFLTRERAVVWDWVDGEGMVALGQFGREVNDRRPDGTIVRRFRHEVEKFSKVLVTLPAAARGGDSGFRDVRAYMGKALALWASYVESLLVLVFDLFDVTLVSEAVTYAGELGLRDALTNAADPRYNEGVGYVYDGTGSAGIVYNQAEYDTLRDSLSLDIWNTGGAPVAYTAFDTVGVLGPGATVTVSED